MINIQYQIKIEKKTKFNEKQIVQEIIVQNLLIHIVFSKGNLNFRTNFNFVKYYIYSKNINVY